MSGSLVLIGFLIIHLNLLFGHAIELQTFKVSSSSSYQECNKSSCLKLASTFVQNCGVMPKVNAQFSPFVARFGEFPWQVAIIDRYEQDFLCSGVLTGPHTVLTATPCVRDVPLTNILVRIGDWDIINEESPQEPFGSEDIPVAKKYFYIDFQLPGSPVTLIQETYNIAILKLRRPVNFGLYPHVSPICLPSVNSLNYSSLTNCYTAGWSDSAAQELRGEEETEEKEQEENEEKEQKSDMGGVKLQKSASCLEGFSVTDEYETFCLHNYLNNIHGVPSKVLDEILPADVQVEEEDAENIYIPDETSFVEEETITEPSDVNDSFAIPSRVLSKAAVALTSRTECIAKLGNDTLNLKSTHLCVFANGDSELCKADVGAPVICLVQQPSPLERENLCCSQDEPTYKSSWKSSKKSKDKLSPRVPQYMVVGIVTKSHKCSMGNNSMPLVAVSVPRMLDFICNIAGNNP